uniref:Brinker DNA-binding domain-containing protein n=1 Tax=Astatotilapia calliptera TaxID=8154 RepID=A0AAX7V4G9_ASTCA
MCVMQDIVVLTTLKVAKRHAYEAQFKLKAISYAEEHGNRAAAREFKINESMVRKWRKLENKLRQVKKTQLSFRGHKARWPELEERLERWIIEQRTSGRSVSTVTIRLKAVSLSLFMKRCHFSIRTRTTVAQQLPADYKEKLAIFRSYCSKHIGDKHIQRWMTDGDHSFTKSGRQRPASYATICQWIVDAWANMSAGTVVRAFAKAGIISEEPHGTESDSDSEESELGMFDGDLAQLFNSDPEDEDFDGFD